MKSKRIVLFDNDEEVEEFKMPETSTEIIDLIEEMHSIKGRKGKEYKEKYNSLVDELTKLQNGHKSYNKLK